MTTVSNHPVLSAPLAPGDGRCAGADLSTAQHAPRDGDEGLVLEDEEVASVEADGIQPPGPGETRALTAALVTSVVDFTGTSPRGGSSRINNARGPAGAAANNAQAPVGVAATKRSPRKRPEPAIRKPSPLGNSSKVGPSSVVPNPLAAMPQQPQQQQQQQQQTQMAVAHTPYPAATTSALMSAAPVEAQPPPPGDGAKTVKFGGEIADIAESMSGALRPDVPPGPPQGRGRIFSIDLDPAVLDFVEHVVDDGARADGPARGPRDRGFSFEFFSFATGDDDGGVDALPPAAPAAPRAPAAPAAGGRPRGDSIIFDPASFREGGIHEASALRHAGPPLPAGPAATPGSKAGGGAPSDNAGPNPTHAACPTDLLNKGGRIGIYLPEERKARIAKFHAKREARVWRKRIKYDCRKKLAESRPRVKGRFVKRADPGDGG